MRISIRADVLDRIRGHIFAFDKRLVGRSLSGVSGTGSKLYIFLMGENPLIARGCVCGLAWYQSK